MKIPIHASGLSKPQLTYCLNVHPGANLQELKKAVFVSAPDVFGRFRRITGCCGPYALGLWLSMECAEALSHRQNLEGFARRLEDAGLYVLSINGFIYGAFHGLRVKEKVYQPDWTDARRLEYTKKIGRVFSALLQPGAFGSISTLPLCYGARHEEQYIQRAVQQLMEAVLFFHRLAGETGKIIQLCLEPEPDCFLEDQATTLAFWEKHLQNSGAAYLATRLGSGEDAAMGVISRHLGLCLDLAHVATVFDNSVECIKKCRRHGIAVGKVQVGAALECRSLQPACGLEAFDDNMYLHQTRLRLEDDILKFPDIGTALARGGGLDGQWRVHYHVPLSWEGNNLCGPTRQIAGPEFFSVALDAGVRHFEVETYTLGVFPERCGGVEQAMARELAWVWRVMTSL